MYSLKFAFLALTLAVTVSAYGPPKKAVLPPDAGKYETKVEESDLDVGPSGYGKPVGKKHGDESYKEVKEVKYDDVEEKDKFEPEENYGGYGKGKKEIVKEEVIKEETYEEPKKDIEGGYLPEVPSGGYKPVAPKAKESYGGYGGGGKGGYGEETFKEKEFKAPKYGGGYGKGPKETSYGEDKYEESPKEIVKEDKIEEVYKDEGYGKPKGGFDEKVIKTTKYGGGYGKVPKEEDFGEDKYVETVKEVGGGYGKEAYGPKEIVKEEKVEIVKGGYEPKPDYLKPVTTLSTSGCNQLMDGLLGKLQHTFTSHMSTVKVERISQLPIGSWARVRMYDGQFDKIGQICRGGDFQVLPQGENIVIRGTIMVPQPKAKFCGDAYLYNRLKVRNRNLALCAKDASFKVQMIVNKKTHKVDVDELEPLAINGFHVEDDKGHRGDALAWPFNKIRESQLGKQKYQFMSTLQHKLCDDFRAIVGKPEIQQEIVSLV